MQAARLNRAELPSITTIDCRYMKKQHYAAAFMINHGREVAFVDNNTSQYVFLLTITIRSVPLLLAALQAKGLDRSQVKYIIVTHIHLDHAGGTAALAKECPDAKILAHPRAVPHLIDPARIIAGAKAVYGDAAFTEAYGEIEPIEGERVIEIPDGATLDLGSSQLEFIHTRGHARHHMVIYDTSSKSIFTGDAFGVSYDPLFAALGSRHGVVFPSSSPIDFEPLEAHRSIDKIISTGAERAYLTHFGVWEDMTRGAELLHEGINHFETILQETKIKLKENVDTTDIQKWGEEKQVEFFLDLLSRDGIATKEHIEAINDILRCDIELNAAGLIVAAQRELRSKSTTE